MAGENLPENFYEKIKPRLHKRISRELRLAGHVLDLECGACELVQYLARTYHQHVTGVDISDGSFPKRRHTSGVRRFRCIRKNAKHLGFANDGAQGAVVSMFAFHEMEHPESILPEACRVLRPGGEVLVIDFPRDSLAQEIWNDDYYEPDEVKRLLQEAGFENVQVRLIQQEQVMWSRGYRPSATGLQQQEEYYYALGEPGVVHRVRSLHRGMPRGRDQPGR